LITEHIFNIWLERDFIFLKEKGANDSDSVGIYVLVKMSTDLDPAELQQVLSPAQPVVKSYEKW